VLDMGEPVKILDLARNMIRLSGKEPETDVAIEYIGAKPGEKLHEELWSGDETVGPTSHAKILRAARRPIDADWLDDELAELQEMVTRGETLDVVSKLATMMREPRRIGAAMLEDTLH
jgi:FlaA1/EpsC-like NDP-sugar epimerase